MKLWFYLLICIFGATMAGYFSGHYNGTRDAANEDMRFVMEFFGETRVEEWLKESGSEKWIGKLRLLGAPRRYMHSARPYGKYMLIGFASLTVGLVGFVRAKGALARRAERRFIA